MPKNFILKPVIVTFDPAFDLTTYTKELELVERLVAKVDSLKAYPFEVLYMEPPASVPETYLGENGKRMYREPWIQKHITDRLPKDRYNFILWHMSLATRDLTGVTAFNGAYYYDKDYVMEAWIAADFGQPADRQRTRRVLIDGEGSDITQFQRLVLHELGHALVHFSGRENELMSRFPKAKDIGDIVHYFDYVEKQLATLYYNLSFKEWSLAAYVVELAKQLVDLLTLRAARAKGSLDNEPSKIVWSPISVNAANTTTPFMTVEPKKSRLDEWAEAIKTFEGWVEPGGRYPGGAIAENGSLSYRNNNPGNLRKSHFQAGQRGGFAFFNTYEDGYKALIHQLRIAADGRSGVYWPSMTLRQFFEVYAPSSDNNHPEIYAQFVAKELGVDVDTMIKTLL